MVEHFARGDALGVYRIRRTAVPRDRAIPDWQGDRGRLLSQRRPADEQYFATPGNNSITTFADGTPLPGLFGGINSFTPITDRAVISNGPAPTAGPVPGIQVEGWLADDPANEARFVLRFPDDWNGKLVVAGASGTRSEYNGDWAWSDYVVPRPPARSRNP